MPLQFTTSYLEDSLSLFRYYKGLAERAMRQVTDDQLVAALDEEMNSIAIIVKHLAGNMLSRFTGFPASDGEKPSRDRDSEFVDAPRSREDILRLWEQGWSCVFAALEPLSETDLAGTTTVRGERHSVMQAINRQLAHYAYHVGQIVFLSRHFSSGHWTSLTIPRGQSAAVNAALAARSPSQR